MSLEILDDRVLVRKITSENKTSGGLVMLTADDSQTPKGIVLKVGKGKPNKDGVPIPLEVKVNDTVMWTPQSGLAVTIDGESLIVLRENDIYAVVE